MPSLRHYKRALITGASAGLGEEFARQLAPHLPELILVARRGTRLELLAKELEKQHSCRIRCIKVDLSSDSARGELLQQLQEEDLMPGLLINNAGLGDYGNFSGASWRKLDSILQVNITALTHLIHGILPSMLKSRHGHILNVSSLASYLPAPSISTYAASKAYVTSLSEALRVELAPYGVGVTALCPGPIRTEFGQVALRSESNDPIKAPETFRITKEKAVQDALYAIEKNVPRYVPGWKVALLALGISTLPIALLRIMLEIRENRQNSNI